MARAPSLVAALLHTSPAARIAFTGLIVAGVAVAAYGLRLHWRDRARVFDRPPAAWPYSEALWKGWVRSLAAQELAFTAGVALVLYGMWGPSDKGVGRVVVIAVLAVAGAGVLLAITVAYFNRPRFAVPPHLRSQPSAIAEWLANWRTSGRRSS